MLTSKCSIDYTAAAAVVVVAAAVVAAGAGFVPTCPYCQATTGTSEDCPWMVGKSVKQ